MNKNIQHIEEMIQLGEEVQHLEEKNCPTNPSKWSYYKSQAKQKFDVYPSAYANGWASKQYKAAGGGWKQCAGESVNESADYKYLTQVILDAKPKHNVYYNSSHNVVNIGGVGYDKGELVKQFNQNPGSSSNIKNNFFHANKDPQKTKREVEKLSNGKIKVTVGKGYGNEPIVYYSLKESVNEEKVYIDFLNKKKGFKQDRIKFNSYEDAVKWAKKNFEKFNTDMIKYESVMGEAMVTPKRGHSYYQLTNDTPIKYVSGHSGLGLEVPGVLLHPDYDTIKGKKGAYIIDYFGRYLYVDIKNKFASDIVNPKSSEQTRALMRNVKPVQMAPEYSDWKKYMKESVNEAKVGDFEIGDFIHFKSKNKTGMVVSVKGNTVTINTPKGKVTGDIKDVHVLYQDNVNTSVKEDENDPQEIKVGNYQTKYFHVCPGASNLYKDIESKGVDMDIAERSVRLQDALFFIEEHIQRDGYDPEKDYVMVAKNIAKNIMKLAKMMGLEEEHNYIQGHIDTIEKVINGGSVNEGNAFTGALFKARKEGLTEFEFNGKKYPVHKLDEDDVIEEGLKSRRNVVREGVMSNIDMLAGESDTFMDFMKTFKKEYPEFDYKNKDLVKWLQSTYKSKRG